MDASPHQATARSRPVVFVLMTYYLPGFKAGGPIQTIRNLVGSLSDEFDFRIFTSDHDVGQRTPYTGIAINDWNDVEGARVFYADASARRPFRLAATVRDVNPDIVYVNSFFSPRFSIVPLALRRIGIAAGSAPWIVAPRGEFSRSALEINPLRKRFYRTVARAIGLHRDVLWQASSPHEATDIHREFGAPMESIRVAPNLTAPVQGDLFPASPESHSGRLSVCFLARVCAMKNLAFVIDTLARCRCPIDLHVYGPVEDEAYAESCRRLVPGDGSTLVVRWHGEVPHNEVRSILAKHDVFFLPTRGENFGHGIFEALAAGVPVLLSDRTPWRDLDAAGVGWVRTLDDHQPFVEAIERLAEMPPDARMAMRGRAHAYAAKVAVSSEARDANRRLFLAALRLVGDD